MLTTKIFQFKGNASNTQLYLISKKFHKDSYFE